MTDKNNSVSALFAQGAHFGYSKSKRHPSAKGQVIGSKDGLDIINLETTVEQIQTAKEKLTEIFAKGGQIVFVGNKVIVRDLTPELAQCDKIKYVSNRWIGGTISNFSEIRKRIFRLKRLMDESEKGEFSKYTKKEVLKIEKEIIKLKKYYEGLIGLMGMPKAIVVVDGKDENIAVKEAADKGIDVISISSTDTDLSKFTYPILANDRSRGTVEHIIKELFSGCNSSTK